MSHALLDSCGRPVDLGAVHAARAGYLVGDKVESYKGELTLTPVPGDTGRTLLTYEPTIVPLTPAHRQDIIDMVTADFKHVRMPFLVEVRDRCLLLSPSPQGGPPPPLPSTLSSLSVVGILYCGEARYQ